MIQSFIGGPIRVATAFAESEYATLFYKALEPHGITKVPLLVQDRWLVENRHNIDAVHFHWPEHIWRSRQSERFGKLRGILGLWKFLRLCHRLKKPVIATVHNLHPHEHDVFWDNAGYRVLLRHANMLICHSRYAQDEVVRRWRPQGQCIVMRIGNYDGFFPPPCPREEFFASHGLDLCLPLVAMVGGLRRYKGIELAIDAIARLNSKVQLLVAGAPIPTPYLAEVEQVAKRVPGVHLIGRFLAPEELASAVAASDVILLPYKDITGSGALMTALTFGKGVVAADLPYFRELLSSHPQAGRFFPAGDAVAMATTIEEYLHVPADRRSRDALALAQDCSWPRQVQGVVSVLHTLLSPRGSPQLTENGREQNAIASRAQAE